MAFKMTPGIKGNPAMNRIRNLGVCGGPGQPPCEPRFQKEVEEKRTRVKDRTLSSRRKSIKPKKGVPVIDAPVKPAQVKLKINLPKGYEFTDKMQESRFYATFEKALENGEYKTQEQLDAAVMKQLKAGPSKPVEGPILDNPGKPVVVAPVKGGGESEAAPIKGIVKK